MVVVVFLVRMLASLIPVPQVLLVVSDIEMERSTFELVCFGGGGCLTGMDIGLILVQQILFVVSAKETVTSTFGLIG